MEDIYILHHDCIQSIQNFEYIPFNFYFNLKLINKLFYFNSFISSLYIDTQVYEQYLTQLQYLTSLKIKCNTFPERQEMWNHMNKLKRLSICIDDSIYDIYDCPVFSNLTYLKIKSIRRMKYFCHKHTTNLKELNLYNITLNAKINYFEKLTNLISLSRSFGKPLAESACGYVELDHQYNSNLMHLKIDGMRHVTLYGMTQLKTKILKNIDSLWNS